MFRNFFIGIKNIIQYFNIIYNDRNYDYDFLLELMYFKLKRMKIYFEQSKVSIQDKQTVKEINKAINALEKYRDCEYNYDFSGETHFLECFFDEIKNNIRGWWN